MSNPEAALAWPPFPDEAAARAAVQTLLEERLIACANILPPMTSVFEWEGKLDESSEVGVLFKTSAALLEPLVERLGECHPYDTPAVIGWRCDAAAPATLAWLEDVLGRAQGRE